MSGCGSAPTIDDLVSTIIELRSPWPWGSAPAKVERLLRRLCRSVSLDNRWEAQKRLTEILTKVEKKYLNPLFEAMQRQALAEKIFYSHPEFAYADLDTAEFDDAVARAIANDALGVQCRFGYHTSLYRDAVNNARAARGLSRL